MYHGSDAYRETAVQTSSPTRLIVMLYEGTIRFLRESVTAIESKELDRKRQSIDRAVAIVQHLQSTLDMEQGGEVAVGLNKLYGYILARILEGSGKLETEPLEEAIKLLNVLLAGWEELVSREQTDTVRQTQLAENTANGGLVLHA